MTELKPRTMIDKFEWEEEDYWMGYCYSPILGLYVVLTKNGQVLTSKNGFIWKKINMEKHLIKIKEVKDIVNKRVLVVKESDGEDLWLPISQVERYGADVFIPKWLADKMGL